MAVHISAGVEERSHTCSRDYIDMIRKESTGSVLMIALGMRTWDLPQYVVAVHVCDADALQ